MLKKLRTVGLLPALIVSVALGISLIAPVSANHSALTVTGCGGYSYPPTPVTPTVTNVSPNTGPTSGGTSVTITGTDFCTVTTVTFGGVAASFVVVDRTHITAVSPGPAAAGTVDVRVTTTIGTSAISSADQFTYTFLVTVPPFDRCSTDQYKLTGNNGSTWTTIDAAKLSLSFTPSVASYALFGGNADLWTTSLGFNQDMGVTVVGGTTTAYPTTAGQPEGWKESGGRSGTFSPNAAFVQTVIPVAAGENYTATLQWKANQADGGTIWAGAGPINGKFSPTCLTLQLIPVADATLQTAVITTQPQLTNNNGTTWVNMASGLSVSFEGVPDNGVILLSANADLWTSTSGFNQDIGLHVSGGAYPTTAGQPEAWKESGGSAGTFSPNAAYVQTVLPVSVDNTYTATIQWKANHADSGTIWAGAGPIGGKFSPTRLTGLFLPTGSTAIDKVSTTQYHLTGSDGKTWQTMDPFTFALSFTPTVDCQVFLGANVDLWTAHAGYNQDIGIVVTEQPLSFPTVVGQPEGWKESGGFAGAFSPNAAFEQTVVSLTGGTTYTFQLVWKTNQPAAGKTIFAGAGPIGGKFSPTRLTLQPISC